MRRRRAIYSTFSVRCASKSPSAPTVPSTVSSSEPSFANALAASAGATPVAVAVVAASKDDEKKDDTFFSSSSLSERRTEPQPCSLAKTLATALLTTRGRGAGPRPEFVTSAMASWLPGVGAALPREPAATDISILHPLTLLPS